MTLIPSAQITPEGQPRFHLPAAPEHPAWSAAERDEAAGGVSADIRIFLDAQVGDGDVLVDLDPGFGFVAMGAVSAPGGMPTVFVAGLAPERFAALQQAAEDIGASLDAVPATLTAATVEQATSRLDDEGRLFVHVGAAATPAVIAAFRAPVDAGRVLALCIGDAHLSAQWPAAAAALADIGYVACGIAEQKGQAILLPQRGSPTSAVIALSADLINGA